MPHIACHIQACTPAASPTRRKNVFRHRAAVCCCIDWRTEDPKGAFETSCASMRKNMIFTIYMKKNICGNGNGHQPVFYRDSHHCCGCLATSQASSGKIIARQAALMSVVSPAYTHHQPIFSRDNQHQCWLSRRPITTKSVISGVHPRVPPNRVLVISKRDNQQLLAATRSVQSKSRG